MMDVLAIVGVGMIGAGLWWHYPPASLVVVGSIVLAAAVLGHFSKRAAK